MALGGQIDLLDEEERAERMAALEAECGQPVLALSAATGEGVEKALRGLMSNITSMRQTEATPADSESRMAAGGLTPVSFLPLSSHRRITVKIGSALLVDRESGLKRDWLASLCADVAAFCARPAPTCSFRLLGRHRAGAQRAGAGAARAEAGGEPGRGCRRTDRACRRMVARTGPAGAEGGAGAGDAR